MTSEQAQRLQLKPRSQLSPMLERCCLRVSANVSYQHAAEDVELFTGMRVSAKTQQRLVQRQPFDAPVVSEPVEEASIDGGTVRLIVEPGQQPLWKQLHCGSSCPDEDSLSLARRQPDIDRVVQSPTVSSNQK